MTPTRIQPLAGSATQLLPRDIPPGAVSSPPGTGAVYISVAVHMMAVRPRASGGCSATPCSRCMMMPLVMMPLVVGLIHSIDLFNATVFGKRLPQLHHTLTDYNR